MRAEEAEEKGVVSSHRDPIPIRQGDGYSKREGHFDKGWTNLFIVSLNMWIMIIYRGGKEGQRHEN